MSARAARPALLSLACLLLLGAAVAQGGADRAAVLMRAGRYAEAASILSPLAVANPRDAAAQYRLGVCLWRTGNLPAAAEAFRRAHVAAPKDAVATASLARVYADADNYERASYWYRKLLLLRPGDMRLTLEAARYSLEQGKPLEAELLLKRALAKNPKDAEGWMQLAQCYQQLGLKGESAQCLEKAVTLKPPQVSQLRLLIKLYTDAGQPDRALPYLQMAAKQRPNDAALQAQIAECYLAGGNARAALGAYRQAVKLAPRQVAYRLALAGQLADSDPAGALREYDQAFMLQQPTAEQLLEVSSLATRAGDSAATLRYLSRLVALRPSDPQPREMLVQAALAGRAQLVAVMQWRELQRIGARQYAADEAQWALRLGAHEWAQGRLLQATPTAADDPALLARLASLFLELENTPQALTLAQRAVEKAGQDVETTLLAAQVLLQAGAYARAEALFRQVYQERPLNWTAARGLGLALLKLDRPQEAFELLQGALRQKPRDYQLVSAYVEVADARGELPRAATLLTELARLSPTDDTLLDGLSAAYRKLGGKDLAARRLHALSESDPANGMWAATAARELVAAGRAAEAAAIYERLARSSEYTMTARVGLCQLLLSTQRYADLLSALARLTGPQAIGPEAYQLLLEVRAELVLQGGKLPNLPALAAAASAVCLADYRSESYYLGMADLYLATKKPEEGVGYLQAQATTRQHGSAAVVGLARLLRKLERPQEARVWLEQANPSPTTPAALLEQATCLLSTREPLEAGLVAEAVLRSDDPALRAQAHLICAEGCLQGYRPEEALWHYCQALRDGLPPDEVLPRLTSLCSTQPLSEVAVSNAVQQLFAQGYTEAALEWADFLSQRPGYGALRQWLVRVAQP